jgi:radical SAM protein with 4Fe4S-binding SPASM domain
VGISIDGRPATHDKFRGQAGAFAASMEAVEACRDAGLRTGLRFTLTKANQGDLPWLLELMEERKVPRLCIYHLAPSGRGGRIGQFAPTGAETRAALDLLFDYAERSAAAGRAAEILTADNHVDNAYLWMRVAERQPDRAEEVWQLLEWNGGNQSGQAIACVDSDGTVYPDQFWRWQGVGNVRAQSFEAIWSTNPRPLLRELRDRRSRLPQRCQGCRFVSICNGNFRSRAEATTGDRWGEDPFCYLSDEEIACDGVSA